LALVDEGCGVEHADQIAGTVRDIFLLLGMASMFGGIPSAFLVFLLRMTRPERRPRVWMALASSAAMWSAIALAAGWRLVCRLRIAEGMEGLAIISKDYPVWLVSCGPAIPVLAALLMYKPASRHAA
jgi:hypothetical protein